jgi:HSP20 family protein
MRVDVIRQEEEYLLTADLPGAKKEDVKIQITDGVMTISAEINSEKKEEKEGYIYSERRSGRMERSFSLEGINEDGITAAYENGVLTIHLPRVKEEEKENTRMIDIA